MYTIQIEITSRISLVSLLDKDDFSDPVMESRSCRLCLKLLMRKIVPTKTPIKSTEVGRELETKTEVRNSLELNRSKSKMTDVLLCIGEMTEVR